MARLISWPLSRRSKYSAAEVDPPGTGAGLGFELLQRTGLAGEAFPAADGPGDSGSEDAPVDPPGGARVERGGMGCLDVMAEAFQQLGGVVHRGGDLGMQHSSPAGHAVPHADA